MITVPFSPAEAGTFSILDVVITAIAVSVVVSVVVGFFRHMQLKRHGRWGGEAISVALGAGVVCAVFTVVCLGYVGLVDKSNKNIAAGEAMELQNAAASEELAADIGLPQQSVAAAMNSLSDRAIGMSADGVIVYPGDVYAINLTSTTVLYASVSDDGQEILYSTDPSVVG